MQRFEGKVAIVTGGGRGIGRAVALLLAREGARVVIADFGGAVTGSGTDHAVAKAVREEIAAFGGDALAFVADVATMDGAKGAVNAAVEAWGRVDILFNGAGIIRSMRIDKMQEAAWDLVTQVNLKSAFAMTHHVVPHMIEQGSGSILCCSSPAGFGQYGGAAYASTKEGLIGFTRSIARELGEFGIRCNAIRPCAESRMFTPEVAEDLRYVVEELGLPPVGDEWFPGMNGEQPGCHPDNVAAAVAWLCLPETDALNARVFYIAGGHLALCPEPVLLQSRYNAAGWNLDSLLSPQVIAQFTAGQRNRYPRRIKIT